MSRSTWAVQLALERFGNVEILVSVAAIRPHKPFWEISYDEWHQVFAVNLHSTFYLAKALVPAMIKSGRGGSIIALGGMASLTAQPRRAHVIATKTGLYGLMKSLALELGPYGIRANLLAPGLIGTERHHPEWYPEGGGVPHGMVSSKSDGTPLGREEGPPWGGKARRRKSRTWPCSWLPMIPLSLPVTASSARAAGTCSARNEGDILHPSHVRGRHCLRLPVDS